MTQEDTLNATATPIVPSAPRERGHVGSILQPWYLAMVPFLVLAIGSLAWALGIALGRVPSLLPPLPDPIGAIDLVGVALVLAFGPLGVLAVKEDKRERGLNDNFPDLLSDLAANRRAGFTLAESVRLAARADYGPLTEHVRTMAAQLSWNVPFEEALSRFAERVDTPLVVRSTTLILEAERSGGQITDVLAAVARDAREIRRLERDRQLSMRTYTMVMYVTFLVFLGVVAVLQGQLVPELGSAAEATSGPGFLSTGRGTEGFRTFFFTATIVQALGSGTMAGYLSRDKIGPGLIHAAAMLAMALVTFSLILA
jgi:flagellar protein FlaJ